jgi:hypothetical protein
MTKTVKAELTEAQKTRRRAARSIGRTLWTQEFEKTNPGADKDATQAAWNLARTDSTKKGATILKALEKSGLELTAKSKS